MQRRHLTTGLIFSHGRGVYADSGVTTFSGDGYRRATFADVAERAARLASGLRELGVGPGDRVATLCWNHQPHLEAYFAVPGMGAVLHTLNLRLLPEQLAWIVNHAEDRVVLVDGSLAPLLGPVFHRLGTIEHVVVVGDGGGLELGAAIAYEDLLASGDPAFAWPELDEEDAASMCYTSGTTGDPKGVVYSHRSTFVHSLAQCSGNTFALSEQDRILLIVPMFHANAWGLPYSGWMAGADFVLPGPHLQAPYLAQVISEERITVAEGVPTIWNDMLIHADAHPVDLSSLRIVICGGSAVPRSLIERYRDRFGVPLVQGWGMTETSPLAALSFPPKGVDAEAEVDYRAKSGRVIAGVEARIVDETGDGLPRDGVAVGELEVRGPWVTGAYFRDPAPDRFRDGWLRTGDVGTIDQKGFIQLTDRVKDVIKSGGEWISSVELENRLMAHPAVVEAAVIGVPDDRWQERPLACVVRRDGADVSASELRSFLTGQVAKWWLPERWAFVPELPKTSVGKFDKRALRALHSAGRIDVEGGDEPGPRPHIRAGDGRRAMSGAEPPVLVHEDRVSAWLENEADVKGPLEARPLSGGNSNATFLLQGPAGDLVLRRPPAAVLSGTAHSMGREHRVLRALDGRGVRAPRPVALCQDPAVTGAPFLVMEHVEGVSITDRLPDAYDPGPDTLRQVGEEMVDALADVHSVDWVAAGLEGFGKPDRFLERQVARWSKQFASYAVRDLPRFEVVAAWLERHLPGGGSAGIMHGDFHLDNCLYSLTEPRLLAIIDWELATIGDPLLDLGLALAFWGERPLEACAMPRIQAVSRLPGAPTRTELARRYGERSGRPVENLDYYMVLAFWKLAAIVEGAYAQFLAGRLQSDYARRLGDDVPRLLEEAARLAALE